MAIFDYYAASKFGPMLQVAFNASSGAAVRKQLVPPGPQGRALFMIRPTQDMRILQGGSAVVVTGTTGTMVQANSYFPMVVENPNDAYISILGDNTNAGTLDITLISDVATWRLV